MQEKKQFSVLNTPWRKYALNKNRRATKLTEAEIDEYVELKFGNKGPHTKKYVKELFMKDDKAKFRPEWIVREDLIDMIKKERPDLDVFDIDYSNLPEIIKNKEETFEVYSHAKIGGIEIGPIKIGIKSTLIDKTDYQFNKYRKRIGLSEYSNSDDIVKKIIEKQGTQKYDFTETVITERYGICKIRCKDCGAVIWTEVEGLIIREKLCPSCEYNKRFEERRQNLEKEFLKKAAEKFPKVGLEKVHYLSSRELVNLICPECNREYQQFPNVFLNGCGICPECKSKQLGLSFRSNLDEFIEKVEKIYGPGTLDFSKAVYITRTEPLTLIDTKTNIEFQVPPNQLLEGKGYGVRHKNSLGERLVQKWLKENNIDFLSEEIEYGPYGIEQKDHHARIDFEVYNKTTWIEYNGRQHYEFNPEFLMYKYLPEDKAREKFQWQINRDRLVREYCEKNNIRLIIIPYTYYSYKKIGDILTKVLLKNEPLSIIKQPEIKL